MSIFDYGLTYNHTEKPIFTIDWNMTTILDYLCLTVLCIDCYVIIYMFMVIHYVCVYGLLYWLDN